MRSLHKTFVLPRRGRTSLKESIAHLRFRRGEATRLEALRGVDLTVERGEFLGVVGRNGSGKSTLLRVAAGIYAPTRGHVEVRGRMSPFIEMGIGFRGDLSAQENVLLNGTILGSSRREMRRRMPQVFEFAGLEGFADVPLKNFSSGMTVRLAFATAIGVEADVLLVDEVLAVGDEEFQRKCFKEFDRLKRDGTTVLLVTHDMDAVRRFCDRAVLLEGGRVAAEGAPEEIADLYSEVNREAGQVHAGRVATGNDPEPPEEDDRESTYRPSALGTDTHRLGRLSAAFARADIQVHYHDSALGYLWSVLRPLGLFCVILLVFSEAAGFSRGVENYPVYLMTGLVLWTFFTECTSGGVAALAQAQATLRRMRFPHLAIPGAVLLKSLFNLATNMIAVVATFAIAGVSPRVSWLELPLLILVLAVLAAGLTMLLSTLFVRFRDIGQAWTVAQQLIFFSTPIVFVSSRYPESLQKVLDLSPLAAIFTEMRHALIDPSAPSAAAAAGGAHMLLVPLGITLGTFALGLWVFCREAPSIAERL